MSSKSGTFLKEIKDRLVTKGNAPDVASIIYLYRFVSLIATSIYYLLSGPRAALLFKMGVVISLLIAAKVTTDIYIKLKDNYGVLRTSVLVETLGITFLLIPTGGAESPFIWYAMNPVLVAASFLAPYFCWINLTFYIGSAIAISILFFNDAGVNISGFLYQESYLIIVLILITLIMQLLSTLTRNLYRQAYKLQKQSKELGEMNYGLQVANERYKDSIEQMMSLYQTVEAFTSQDSQEGLIKIFVSNAVELIKTENVFFWMNEYEGQKGTLISSFSAIDSIKQELIQKIEDFNRTGSMKFPVRVCILDRDYIISNVRSASRCYGLMAIELREGIEIDEQRIKKLVFLSELASVVLDRFELEKAADRLLVNEEQNRIANEMHDSISQRLFSITCALHALSAKLKSSINEELQNHLEMVIETANGAAKELHRTIYRLSSRKNGEYAFEANISAYLKNMASLNDISISTDFDGDEGLIPTLIKSALYRIICEASGNAVRHGKCSSLEVIFKVSSALVELSVIDNGRGFKVQEIKESKDRGLGIYNIESLVSSFNGELNIMSQPGKGTEVQINIPLPDNHCTMKGGIAV
jgi:two-component system, NarL family, sensor histidine kinase LiaS